MDRVVIFSQPLFRLRERLLNFPQPRLRLRFWKANNRGCGCQLWRIWKLILLITSLQPKIKFNPINIYLSKIALSFTALRILLCKLYIMSSIFIPQFESILFSMSEIIHKGRAGISQRRKILARVIKCNMWTPCLLMS